MYQLSGWFTDLMDVYRVENATAGGLTRQERTQVLSAVPCRVYAPAKNTINLRDGAATTRADEKLACAVDVDIQAGDEIIVTRGAVMGHTRTTRYIASQPVYYYDPVGGAATGLEHQEVGIRADNIVR